MREEVGGNGFWPRTEEEIERDLALTAKEMRHFKILIFATVAVALICCGAGIGLGWGLA
jgi:hypothetical protein